jgi:hypothetical protein
VLPVPVARVPVAFVLRVPVGFGPVALAAVVLVLAAFGPVVFLAVPEVFVPAAEPARLGLAVRAEAVVVAALFVGGTDLPPILDQLTGGSFHGE